MIGGWIAQEDESILQSHWGNKVKKIYTIIARHLNVDLEHLLDEAIESHRLHEQIHDIIIQQIVSSLFQNIDRGRIQRTEFTMKIEQQLKGAKGAQAKFIRDEITHDKYQRVRGKSQNSLPTTCY